MDWPVTYRRKIRFSDTDAQGIVFNGNYATYIDDTITDYFDAIGLPWDAFTRSGHDMVLARTETDFRSAGRLGETLVTARGSLASARRPWSSRCARGRELRAGGHRSATDPSRRRPQHAQPKPVPDFFIEAVERLKTKRSSARAVLPASPRRNAIRPLRGSCARGGARAHPRRTPLDFEIACSPRSSPPVIFMRFFGSQMPRASSA